MDLDELEQEKKRKVTPRETAMDEQIVPGFNRKLAAVGAGAPCVPGVPSVPSVPGIGAAGLRKAQSVSYGLTALDTRPRDERLGWDQAVPSHMFVPVPHIAHGIPTHAMTAQPAPYHLAHAYPMMPVAVPVPATHAHSVHVSAQAHTAASMAAAAAAAAAAANVPQQCPPKVANVKPATGKKPAAKPTAKPATKPSTNKNVVTSKLAGSKRAADTPPASQPPAQKPRWETPTRAGTWPEAWQSAVELADDAPAKPESCTRITKNVRSSVADVIASYVGDQLPRPTAEKWLCLLSEYLELNADEQILVVCLLRRYIEFDGRLTGEDDHLRPQKWERVVAVCCYIAVLLSEEFPGRTATDLRELLGQNFRFGAEQIAFLKKVEWRISISHESFVETKRAILNNDREKLAIWFKTATAAQTRNRQTKTALEKARTELAATQSKKVAKTTVLGESPDVWGHKKLVVDAPSPEDCVVPGAQSLRPFEEDTFVPLWA